MAFQDFSNPRPEKWVTLGGRNKETGKLNPTSAKGYYLGSFESQNKFNKDKKNVNLVLMTPQGLLGLTAPSHLVKKMKENETNLAKRNVDVRGLMVEISFVGEQDVGKGNPMKLFKVGFDPENRGSAELTLLSEESESNYSDDEPSEDDYEAGGVDFPTDAEEESYGAVAEYVAPVIQQNVAASAKERAAKVQALLAKNKKN